MIFYFDDPNNVDKLVQALKDWHGTPWMFNARVKGQGADCSNYVAGVLIDCGARGKIIVPPHPNWYFIHKEDNRLLDGIINLGVEENNSSPNDGDLIMFKVGKSIAHIGIYYNKHIYHSLYKLGTSIISWNSRPWQRRKRFVFRLKDRT